MKIAKTIFTLLLLTSSLTIFAQLNPIKNLIHQGDGYQFGNPNCPQFNCYALTWTKPDTSYTDTLTGYNIYKNNIFYRYTTQTNASCEGFYPCSYMDFFDNVPFWLTVKAVYNRTLESIADDSIHIVTFAIDVKEFKMDKLNIIKNPVKLGENITILIPNTVSNYYNINVISQKGELIKEYNFKDSRNNVVNISTNRLSQGIYYINLKTDKNTFTSKLIIE